MITPRPFHLRRVSHAKAALRPAWVAGAFALAALAVYANGLSAPFVFDDIPSIPENPSLRQLWPLQAALSPPGEGLTVSGRPLLNFSFALNYAAGAGPRGYRVTNILIHVCSALLLFGLIRRTLRANDRPNRFAGCEDTIAALVSGLWLMHPLQTSAVTYIVQRAESLSSCFYLLTLYAFVCGVESRQTRRWLTLSVVACLLGMATKEMMVSAPVVVAVYDRLFAAQSWKELWRQRKGYYLALGATWALLLVLVTATGGRGGTAGFSLGVGWLQYWATQFRAIVHYLALSIWPQPLVLDYGVEWAGGAGDVIPYAIMIICVVAATVVGIVHGKRIAWLGVVYFAVLAPTSLLPGGRQTVAEHRMYLPLAAVLAALVLGLWRIAGRRALFVIAASSAALGTITVRRNADYRSTLSIWADTVAKRPDNRWARDNLGNALMAIDRPVEALAHYKVALRLDPTDAVHQLNTGHALTRLGHGDDALSHFREATRLAPNYAKARITFGDALFHRGRIDEAIAEFRRVIVLRPEDIACSYALGSLLLQHGRLNEAAVELQRTLGLAPNHAEAAANLGSALAQLGRINDAMAALRQAARLNPANPEPHNNLGAIFLHLGRNEEAAGEFAEALRLNPDHAMARQNLARLNAAQRLP